jgi:hypothetical protein
MSSKTSLSSAAIIERRQEMAERLKQVQAARAELALLCLEGDATARKKNSDFAEKERQYIEALSQFESALITARAREDAARREREAGAARARAAVARQNLHLFRQHGADMDVAARALAESFARFEKEAAELTRSGGPSIPLIRTASRRALASTLIFTGLDIGHLAPSERHSFAELIDSWSRGIEGWCARAEQEKCRRGKGRVNAPDSLRYPNH